MLGEKRYESEGSERTRSSEPCWRASPSIHLPGEERVGTGLEEERPEAGDCRGDGRGAARAASPCSFLHAVSPPTTLSALHGGGLPLPLPCGLCASRPPASAKADLGGAAGQEAAQGRGEGAGAANAGRKAREEGGGKTGARAGLTVLEKMGGVPGRSGSFRCMAPLGAGATEPVRRACPDAHGPVEKQFVCLFFFSFVPTIGPIGTEARRETRTTPGEHPQGDRHADHLEGTKQSSARASPAALGGRTITTHVSGCCCCCCLMLLLLLLL